MNEPRATAIRLPGGDRIEIDTVKVIGRDSECDVVLDDPMASAQHAKVEPVTDGLEVTDLGSGNGTLVEGIKIDGPVVVRPGEKITIGLQLISVLGVADAIEAPDFGSVVDETDHSLGASVSVVTAPAIDDGADDADRSASGGVNPAARKQRKLGDTEMPALGFAMISGGAFVLVALVSFGVLALVL